MSPRLQQVLHAGLRRSGLLTASRWWHRRGALILTFHGGRGARAVEMFERQAAYLARHYHIVTLAELARRLHTRQRLRPYTLVLTLEESRRNHLTAAVRILQRHKLPATVFLTTAYIGSEKQGLWTERVDWLVQSAQRPSVVFDFGGDTRSLALTTMRDRIIASAALREYLKKLPPRQREASIARLAEEIGGGGHATCLDEPDGYLSWEELRALKNARLDFGAHTHTGALMSTLSPAEAFYEVSRAQRLIQNELDCACEFFSYPCDTVCETPVRDRDLFKKLGFKAALGQGQGFNSPRADLYALRRFHLWRCADFNFFLAKITGAWSVLKKL